MSASFYPQNDGPLKQYRLVAIPKGRRGFRFIYSPEPTYKARLRQHCHALRRILENDGGASLDHAFEPNRNCVTNALVHLGKRYLLSMDVTDFFDSITRDHLHRIPAALLDDVLIDGAPRQGLPTSPLVANIAMLDVDHAIVNAVRSFPDVTYSRYADDLTFGTNDAAALSPLKARVSSVLQRNGLAPNPRKTRIQSLGGGRIVITGVALSEFQVHPTRKSLRKLRAAINQQNMQSAAGLSEWATCSLPRTFKMKK